MFSLGSMGLLLSAFRFKNHFGGDGLEPREAPYKPDISSWNDKKISLCWIGHSTFFVNFYGTKILTDPVFSNRIGLYALITNLGPKRIVAPAVRAEEIPPPDLILLSHAHFDHLDYPTLKYFSEKYPHKITVITSYKTKDIFEELPFERIIELDWDESIEIKSLRVKAIQVKHFGWRYPWENDRSKGFKNGRSYNSYILEKNGKKILFAGDTAYTELFKPYSSENIEIAMMPIGAYNPWRFTHCNPEEALKMADDMNAKYFVPMHTRTFPHGREPFDEPNQWLKSSAPRYKTKIALYEVGETFTL